MDCIHARLLIVLHSRDAHELDADAAAGLEQHLEQCADCLAWSHQESRVDEALAHAVQAVPVPAQLPSKILHQLEHRRRPRRLPWIAAAAASVLVALGLGWHFYFNDKPVLSMVMVQEEIATQEISTPIDVGEFFAESGLRVEVPQDFNFEHYNGSSIAVIRGFKIPRLEFVNRGDGDTRSAVVYVLAKDRFNVDDIVQAVNAPPIVTSKHHLEVRLFSDHPGFVYVVVYTGGIRPFFLIASA